MNIKDKLRQIESLRTQRPVSTVPYAPTQPSNYRITDVVPGEVRPTVSGSFFYHEKDFPLEYRQGTVRIDSFLAGSSSLLSLVGKSHGLQGIDLRNVLFLDTETTSLSGGAGSCAFLIGVGYFTNTSFRIGQYFMTDFRDECAQLCEINQLLESYELLVSYNGKSFDAPLLESRNVFNRLAAPVKQIRHLDLLHAVRRLWKHKLMDCSLTTVENRILNASRTGDIPGYFIPQVYFEYVRTNDARKLGPVFYHNQEDIISLVALNAKMMQVFEEPMKQCGDLCELLAVCRVHEDMSQYDKAVDLYNEILSNRPLGKEEMRVKLCAAFAHKKLRNWSGAAKIWRDCLDVGKFHPLPFIELAKHCEHREKNYNEAIGFVERALNQMSLLEMLDKRDWEGYKSDLMHRKRRLTRKVSLA